MKFRSWLVGLAISVSTVSAAHAQAPPVHSTKPKDALFGPDKVKHFLIAGFVESVMFSGLQAAGANRNAARSGAISAAAAASIGRELHDRKTKGLFSIPDLVWDALGVGAALVVLNKTQK